MKINQIILETSAGATGSGSVATVAKPMGETQSRYPEVKGLKLIDKLKGKKKGPYSNSLSESKVEEAKLEEDDLIIVPGQSKRFKPGLIPKAQDRTDHEVEMALSDLYQAYKNAKKTYMLLKNRTEEEGLEGWVQEKIIKANDYLNTIREYYEHQAIQNEMTGGVIGNGMAGESATKKVNPYAVGMSQAMKSTGDKPPLKKSTIVKGHHIAKKIKQQDVEEGWKSKLAGAALAGAAAFGGGGAHAADLSHYNTQYLQQVVSGEQPRPMVSIDDARAELQARANGKQQAVSNQSDSQPSAAQQARANYIKQLPKVDSVERTSGSQAIVTFNDKDYQGTILQPDDPRPRFGPNTSQAKVDAAQLGFRGLGTYIVYFVNDRAYIEMK